VKNATGIRDPAFSDNKDQPIHRWVPWIAGFSSRFVDKVIDAFGSSASCNRHPPCLLDPFCGVGTTLVQGMLRGWSTIGFEINPYAALASRIKVESSHINLDRLEDTIQALRTESREWGSSSFQPHSQPPEAFKSRIPFFSPQVEKQVLCLLDFIDRINDNHVRDIVRLAFGAVMVSFSNYSYEPSLGTRPAAGKPLVKNADVAAVVSSKIRQVVSDIKRLYDRLGDSGDNASHEIYTENFLSEAKNHLATRSVDLMITSPPYMNNYHYVRNTRPQLYWLSLIADGLATKDLEVNNFGKFWQTVRAGPPVEPTFVHKELFSLVQKLRTIRVHRGPYGGPGWANYVISYFNDCHAFLKVLHRLLKRGGVGVIVIGNSIIQGIEFKVDRLLADLGEQQGFFVVAANQIREKRVGASITRSSVRRGASNRAALYESAVVLKKK